MRSSTPGASAFATSAATISCWRSRRPTHRPAAYCASKASPPSGSKSKSYTDAGLIAGRPGQGTFVRRSLSQSTPAAVSALSKRLARWIAAARDAGLDDDGIMDIVRATMRAADVDKTA